MRRLAYRRRGKENLHPADGVLNLPADQYSHRVRQLAAIEASRGSFDDAAAAVHKATGQAIGKRQIEELARRAATDVDDFYICAPKQPIDSNDTLILSADGKGVVMRPEALRAATKAAAEQSTPKLPTRLSRGEKRNRKRMAEVGAVYDATPVVRAPADIMAPADSHDGERPPAPKAKNKWYTVSVVEDAASVIAQVFAEADRRDPEHQRRWVALVDGNQHQIDRIQAEARRRALTVTIVIDFIHVLEYLWKAAWSFYREGDPEAEAWVREKALAVLEGKASTVAAAIRRKATCLDLDDKRRKRCRHLRRLPPAQEALPRLPEGPAKRLADRHRHHRGRLPPPRQGPHGHHRCALGTRGSRGRPQAAGRARQRRLRRLLDIPSRKGAPQAARGALRRTPHPAGPPDSRCLRLRRRLVRAAPTLRQCCLDPFLDLREQHQHPHPHLGPCMVALATEVPAAETLLHNGQGSPPQAPPATAVRRAFLAPGRMPPSSPRCAAWPISIRYPC